MRPLLSVMLLVAATGAAWAGDVSKAKEHFKAGLAAFTLGDYVKAAAEYEAAYSEEPDPALLYNAAQAQRLAGNKPRALFLYQNYLRYFPTQSNRAEVQRHIANLQSAIESDQKAKTTPPTDSKPIEGAKPAEPAPPPVEKPVEAKPAEVPSEAMPAATTEAPPKKRTPKWVWGVVGGVVAAAAIGLGVGLGIGLSGNSYPNADIGSGKLH
jgi:tetratricopeptide (TPR) repeat protein